MDVKVNIGTTMPEPPYCNEAGMRRLAELDALLREGAGLVFQALEFLPEEHAAKLHAWWDKVADEVCQ